MKKALCLIVIFSMWMLVACSDDQEGAPVEDQLVGTWNGAIEVEEQPLNIIIEFDHKEKFTGNISIPIQNLNEFSLTHLKFDGENISFEMPLPGQKVMFEGTLEDEDLIEGTFTQEGQEYPFHLERGQLAGQTGERSEPEDLLTVETEHGELQGELLMPEGEEPYPVALIIPGSGPTGRDGNSKSFPGKNNSLKLVAESLAEEGIASIRYSKRGVRENEDAIIPEKELRFKDFVNDAKAWLNMIHRDERFSEVSVIGHSQGSLVGMLAAQDAGADHFISVAGAGMPIDQVILDQIEGQVNEKQLNEFKDVLNKLNQGKTVENVSPDLYSFFAPELQPFLISWMKYDPAEEIKKLNMPVLIVQGTHDVQISLENANRLANANLDAEKLIIEEMDHVLKESTSNLNTYANPDLPLAEGLMEGIINFIKEDK